jgi:hypothetical protein
MFAKTHLLLPSPVVLQGHTIRSILRPFRGVVSVEVVCPSARGGTITKRWQNIGQLKISLADLESAVRKLGGVHSMR